MFSLVRRADEFEALLPEWDGLASAVEAEAPLACPSVALALWNHDLHRRAELHLAVGRSRNGGLRAVMALVRSGLRRPMFGIDIVQPMALPGLEPAAPMVAGDGAESSIRGLCGFLLADADAAWDALHLPRIRAGGVAYAALVEAAAAAEYAVLASVPAGDPVVHPPPPGTDLLSGLRPALRQRVGEARNQARAGGMPVVCREISWEYDHWAADLAALHARTPGPASSLFADGGSRAAVRQVVRCLDRHFRSHVFACFVADRLVAAAICFHCGSDVHVWQVVADSDQQPLDAGLLLVDHVLHAVAGWSGVRRILLPGVAGGAAADWGSAGPARCELAIVRASGRRRRRALRAFPGLRVIA